MASYYLHNNLINSNLKNNLWQQYCKRVCTKRVIDCYYSHYVLCVFLSLLVLLIPAEHNALTLIFFFCV